MPSLYANLLDPTAPKQATISGAPVKYDFKPEAEPKQEEKKPSDASLKFQPIKRPQVIQKPKSRPVAASHSPDNATLDRKPPSIVPVAQNTSSIEKWTAEDELGENPYAAEYNRRKDEERRKSRWANKKRKKKNKETARVVDFDEIYDPENPIRLEDYRGSEEQAQAEHEWKQLLHAHQFKRRKTSIASSEEEGVRAPQRAYAPPSNYNFAPPTFNDAPLRDSVLPTAPNDDDDDVYEPPSLPALAETPIDAAGVDSYTRGIQFAGAQPEPPPPPPPSASLLPPPPQFGTAPGTSPSPTVSVSVSAPRSGTISAAPVRYEIPKPSARTFENQAEEPTEVGGLGFNSAPGPTDSQLSPEADLEDEPRSNRPGQRGFAKRLLQRYGWQEGQGLGASGTGITTILRHQTEKRKKRPDAEGGGWAGPAAMGKIVGGKKRKTDADDEDGDGAAWSIVAKFEGMLDGIDVAKEVSEGNLMQDIGDMMGKYGVVERLFIDRSAAGSEVVFAKFTSALSAYRAIQASNENDFLGNGRVARSSFWDADKFEQGIYG